MGLFSSVVRNQYLSRASDVRFGMRAVFWHACLALALGLGAVEAQAINDPYNGINAWYNTVGCTGCHATPQPTASAATGAFSGYGSTVNILAFYANNGNTTSTANGANIAGAANTPTSTYIIPTGNTATYWNGVASVSCVGIDTSTCAMSGYSVTLGSSAAPTQTANDVSAYFASLYSPVLTQPGNVTLASGAGFSYQMAGTYLVTSLTAGYSTTYGASATGLTFTVSTSGLVTATMPTVTTPTNYTVTISAANPVITATYNGATFTYTFSAVAGTPATKTFTITVNPPPPTVSTISPNYGPTTGGTAITISGTYLNTVNSVTIGGVAATAVTYNAGTGKITATTPAGTAGAKNVVLTNTSGGNVTATNGFTYYIPPTVSGVSPSGGPVAGSTVITISGTNLSTVTGVTVGGVAATGVTYNAGTGQISATTPAGTAGAQSVVVTTLGGTASGTFTYYNSPTISSISPNGGPVAGGTGITISGTNLSSVTGVTVGGVAATGVTYNAGTGQITATTPAGTAGAQNVVVTTLGGQVTSTGGFTYYNAPTINAGGITPTSGPTSGGTAITITGTNFVNGSTTVTIGGVAAVINSVSATSISATTSLTGTAGTQNVVVTTPGGTATATSAFTYWAPPTVTSVSPNSGSSTGGTTITINGSNFVSGNVSVTVGGVAATNVTWFSSSQITASTPVGTTGTTVDVIVTSTGGSSTVSASDKFTYGTAPTVTSVSPNSGSSTGGTSVTINGANLSGATAVKFGATSATINSNNGSQIIATAPAGTAGTVDITVVTACCTSAITTADQFTYVTAPVITSATSATGSGGTAFSYTITATQPPITSYNATGLPAGLSVNTSNGQITGTPTVNGTFPVTISATNAAGTGSTTLTITLNPTVPAITSSLTAAGSGGTAFNYQITASNVPTSYNATGLPSGLSVNTSTGLISGTPSINGTFNVTITASNTAGTSPAATLALTLNATTPVVSSATTAAGSGGTAFNYQITASNVPTSYNATGLPSGLTVNTASGLISGTPTVNGTFPVTISATNAAGTGSATLTITLSATAPVLTSTTTASGSGGAAFSYQITANNVPTSYSATGLPAGLTLNPTTGLISGTPTVNGTFNVTISAINGAGTSTATLTITLSATIPAITSALTATGSGGAAFSYQITASNVPTSYNATGLPAGVTVNTTTGLISGTPTVNGTFNVTITASNAAGTSPAATLAVTLNAIPPVITSATTATGTGGAAFSYQITATDVPTSYNATGLPAGLSVNTATGLVSGTPTNSGTFNATISASNAAGTGSATLKITLGSLPTTAAATTMTVKLNTAATIDLAPFITGTTITGINIVATASHGTTTVSGTKVTYTPANDYFGSDTFKYVAYGSGGTSAAATVTITIIGRPDPTKDINVPSLINLQTETAKRFHQAQMFNFQQRMESLHHVIQADVATSYASRNRAMEMAGDVASLGDANLPPSASQPVSAAQSDSPMQTSGPSNAPGQNNDSPGVLSSVLLANSVVSVLTTSSLNLNLASLTNSGKPNGSGGLKIWGAGNLRYGTKNQPGGGSNIDFSTNGVSIGADQRFSDQLTLGMGIGYARDKNTIGTDGTGSTSTGNSVAAYASYQGSSTMFIDGLLGYGTLSMDTTRYVAPINDFARSNRSGNQTYGSLATGYEYRDEGMLLSPYARYDLGTDRLKAATETGAGLYALNYASQSTRSQQISLGFRAESQHQIDAGTAQPRVRIEYQHHIEGAGQTSIAYADLISTRYNLTIPTTNSNSVVLGIGSGFALHSGLSLDIDYQRQHSTGHENSQAFNFRLSKYLD